ncbi:MAG: histidine phosphatase family protein [Pseudomonadales bacterium]
MATIHLVRHGKAAAGFDGHADPGLDDLGRAQAAATAAMLAPNGPLPVFSSPLARARETAEPLAARWHSEIIIEPRVAEIPSPTEDLQARAAWLRQAMGGGWSDLEPSLQSWRQALVECVIAMPTDAVVFCHFVAINVAVGAAQGDDRMVIFSPDNGSVTTLTNEGGRLEVLDLGRTAQTHIN